MSQNAFQVDAEYIWLMGIVLGNFIPFWVGSTVKTEEFAPIVAISISI